MLLLHRGTTRSRFYFIFMVSLVSLVRWMICRPPVSRDMHMCNEGTWGQRRRYYFLLERPPVLERAGQRVGGQGGGAERDDELVQDPPAGDGEGLLHGHRGAVYDLLHIPVAYGDARVGVREHVGVL